MLEKFFTIKEEKNAAGKILNVWMKGKADMLSRSWVRLEGDRGRNR